MNVQLNLGIVVVRFSICKRKNTLTINHEGVKYFVCPQVERPSRVSVFRVNRFSTTYLCPLGRKDTHTAEAMLPPTVFRQAAAFMRARNNREHHTNIKYSTLY